MKIQSWVEKQTTATKKKKQKIKLTNMDYIFLCENGTSRFFYKNWNNECNLNKLNTNLKENKKIPYSSLSLVGYIL